MGGFTTPYFWFNIHIGRCEVSQEISNRTLNLSYLIALSRNLLNRGSVGKVPSYIFDGKLREGCWMLLFLFVFVVQKFIEICCFFLGGFGGGGGGGGGMDFWESWFVSLRYYSRRWIQTRVSLCSPRPIWVRIPCWLHIFVYFCNTLVGCLFCKTGCTRLLPSMHGLNFNPAIGPFGPEAELQLPARSQSVKRSQEMKVWMSSRHAVAW